MPKQVRNRNFEEFIKEQFINTQADPSYYSITMRSRTTFKTDTDKIQVWPGQDKDEVAARIADGYGADVVEIVEIGHA